MRKGISILLVLFIISSFVTEIIHSQPALQKSDAVGLEPGVFVNSTKLPEVVKTRQSNINYNVFGNIDSPNKRRCPLCDKSVFPYCSEKLFHDACCCTDPYQYPLPYKCQYADCAFLHANSCREHRLISNCCCSDEYRSLLRGLGKSSKEILLIIDQAASGFIHIDREVIRKGNPGCRQPTNQIPEDYRRHCIRYFNHMLGAPDLMLLLTNTMTSDIFGNLTCGLPIFCVSFPQNLTERKTRGLLRHVSRTLALGALLGLIVIPIL